MKKNRIFLAGTTAACRYAGEYLAKCGIPVSNEPAEDASYILLDVPSFRSDGQLRQGGQPEGLLMQLPMNVTICGGNLDLCALRGYRCIDFLKDEAYLCRNAYITAECALDVAMPLMGRTFRHCPVLIVGWGRIGKCLAQLLKDLGARVTLGVRDSRQAEILKVLGYDALLMHQVPGELGRFRLIYNTVPAPVLSRGDLSLCREDCVKIELASGNGLEGEDIVIARGLPGIHMPESSGRLIAETFLRLLPGGTP